MRLSNELSSARLEPGANAPGLGGFKDFDKTIAAQFPIKRSRIYLDTASIGPLSEGVTAAVGRMMSDARDNGGVNYPVWRNEVERGVRSAVAALVGAEPRDLAFVKNTTEGLLIVANGIDWREGDNVIVPDIEYPSNVYCWLHLARHGVAVKWFPARIGRLPSEDLERLIDRRTRLVTLSGVQFSNGYRHDLTKAASICRQRGVLLNVDAAQWIGALALDATKEGVDFFSTGGHKWLHGPIGTGFFYCARDRLESLVPSNIGYHSVDKDDDHLDYELKFRDDAGRFEEALINIPGLVGLGAAVELLLAIGPRRIEERILALTGMLIEGLQARGYLVVSPLGEGERSGIVSFRHARIGVEDIVTRLHEAGVEVAGRVGAVRASPSFFNDHGEIDAMLEALPK
jgi:selenocysteine lyase/cysteine desulfurase